MKGLLCALLIGLVCAARAEAAQLDLTERENGKDLRMDRGDLLVIRLPSNSSTGYSWSVTNSKPRLLVQEGGGTIEVPKASKGLVGAGGTGVWKFRAKGAGTLQLTFCYARQWEKGVPPLRVVGWPVTIRSSKPLP